MSSYISDRRLDRPELDVPPVEDDPAVLVELDELFERPELELVEYFVEVLEVDPGVFTSVPKCVQFEQTSSFAPSTLIVVGDGVSAPHISH